MAARIEDYGLIGDLQSAALVAVDGSIDWLCLPRFDSGACFAALLGTPDHGRWLLAPAGEVRQSRRRYRPETLILETDFETADGEATVIDCMPIRGQAPDVVRVVVGRRGQVRMHMELVVRFDYGSIVPWVRREGQSLSAIAGPNKLRLRTPIATRGEHLKTVADFTVSGGARAFRAHLVSLVASGAARGRCRARPRDTAAWWQRWSKRCTYEGEWREAVLRSLITLKALTYEPTGGIVAAATTSLPEQLGGVRNWDYRYCWLRDATFTLYALLSAGYTQEAEAWREWLLRAVAGSPARLQIMYGLAGERRLDEYEIPWLPGYEGARASAHRQRGVEPVPARRLRRAARCHAAMPPQRRAAGGRCLGLERAIIEFLGTAWDKPDEGIWEVRGPRRHFTHSQDDGLASHRSRRQGGGTFWPGGAGASAGGNCATRSTIRCAARASIPRWGPLCSTMARELLDASLLMMPLVGFLPASDPRVASTVAAIERDLMHDGFVARYSSGSSVDGLPPGEGAFLACTFWLVDNFVLLGRHQEARALFERLLSIRNDLGLLSEEYDPHAHTARGQFPPGFFPRWPRQLGLQPHP